MRYGICTVVIEKTEYIIGAITMANNIRKNFINYELIVLVNGIEDKNINILKMFFDRVIKIELIDKNIRKSRFSVLKLVEYDKILLLDADAIILQNIDEIFELEIEVDRVGCINIEGEYHPSFMLIKPDKVKYNEIVKNKRDEIKYIFKNFIKIEDRYLINSEIYDKNENKEEYKGIQFRGDKPFIVNKEIELSKRIYRKDFKIWFEKYREVKKLLYEYENDEIFKEVNTMMKYFLYKPQERYKVIQKLKEKHKNIKKMKKEYKIENVNNIEYLHDNISKNYLITNTNKIIDDNIKDMMITDNTVSIIMIINNMDRISDELREYVIYEMNIRVSGRILKHIIFNSDIFYTYDERKRYISNFNDYMSYDILIVAIKTIENLMLRGNNENVYIYNNMNNKLLLMSMIYDRGMLNEVESFNMYNIDKGIMERMRLESLKKYIYNNYSYEEIKNILVREENNNYVIYDYNNKYDDRVINDFIIVKNYDRKMSDKYYEYYGIKIMI